MWTLWVRVPIKGSLKGFLEGFFKGSIGVYILT